MKGGPICAILLVLISLASTGHHAASAAARGADAERMADGVWLSRGYGWLWEIADGRIKRFEIGEGFCIPRSREQRLKPESEAELSDDGQTLRLRLGDPAYVYTFDRVHEVPDRCRERPSVTPHLVMEVALELFETHYAFFEQRGIDWEDAKATARGRMHAGMGDAELLEVLKDLLARFGDGHVGLEAEIRGKEVSINGSNARVPLQIEGRPAVAGAWSSRAAVASLKRARRRGDGTLIYGRLGDEIGYLKVNEMSGMGTKALESALDKAMKAFDDVEAVIVDVTGNDGGDDTFARRIARRFAAEPTIAYSKHAGDFAGAQPQEVMIEPTDRPGYLGPVYVITDRRTASAAEIFVMAMRALPNVVHLGEPTDGSLSDILSKPLPNGWRLSLSNEVYLDAEGNLWEGSGIPPHVPLRIAGKGKDTREARQAVLDLVEFIRARL